MLTDEQEKQILDMLALHLQLMKTHALSFQMEGKSITDPSIADIRAQHKIEAAKCRTIMEDIIKKSEGKI
jgi:hypothetical protein